MPTLIPYSLTFHGGLHLGGHSAGSLEEAGLPQIPSDTLFSALLDVWQRRGGDVARFAAPFVSDPPDPPFLLTSAFPRVGSIRFYPMPVDLMLLFHPDTIRARGKELKRIRYISEALLRKALQRKNLLEPGLDKDLFPEDEGVEPSTGAALQQGAMWFSLEEMEYLPENFKRERGRRHAFPRLNVWNAGQTPRVTVSRAGSATALYHAGRVVFAQGCGLWFGLSWLSPETRISKGEVTYSEAVAQALSLLQHDGLGGERSSGYGAFEFSAGKSFPLGANATPRTLCFLLSRYHPRAIELPDALGALGTAYNLTRVAGWLHSPEGPAQRRQSLAMVSEGSLVAPPTYPAGDVCDVRPTYQNPEGDLPHPVYRYGLACGVGWPLG